MSRHRLLAILQQRCTELGVRAEFSTPAPDALALAAGYDLVVAADGANSLTRARLAGLSTRKGHELVELDVLLVANGNRPVTHIRHSAIYRLREPGPVTRAR